MINSENKPTDWRFRDTPNPITSLGDDRWNNYSAEIDFKFADSSSDNYILFGSRYLTAELNAGTAENGYSIRIYPDGRWELRKNSRTVIDGSIDGFDNTVWHTVNITAVGNVITASIDRNVLHEYTDEEAYNHSGRVCIGRLLPKEPCPWTCFL